MLSPWLIPYVYENRNGVDPEKFQDSPADSDSGRRYSVRVDDGIYVYSVNEHLRAEMLDETWWEYNGAVFLGGVLVLVAVSCVVILGRWSRKGAIAGVVAFLLSAGAGSGLSLCITCQAPSAPQFYYFCLRRMFAQRRQLPDPYHQSGVIGDEICEKAVSALGKRASTRPASRPSKPE